MKLFEKDKAGEDDPVKEFDVRVKDGKLQREWKFEYIEDTDDENSDEEQQEKGYTKPEFVFFVQVDESTRSVESGVLEMKDWVEFTGVDENGNILPNHKFKIISSNGEEIEGQLDENGYGRIDNVKFSKEWDVEYID